VVCVAIVVFLIGMFETGHIAFSQQQQSAVDLKARSHAILAYLNAIVRFYRQSTTPAQKIGEPNDVVYRDQSIGLTVQAVEFAFQSAKAEAALMAAYQRQEGMPSESTSSEKQRKLETAESNVEKQLSDLKARMVALDQQIASAKPKNLAALQSRRKQIQDAIELASAMTAALQKIIGISDAQGKTALAASIDSLQRTMPELNSKTAPVAVPLEPLDSVLSSGVSTQTIALFELLGSEHALDSLIHNNDDLHSQALALQYPLSNMLRGLIGRGQQLAQQAMDAPVALLPTGPSKGKPSSAQASRSTDQQSLDSITATFKALSTANVPLSQGIIVLERSRANLVAWKAAVDREYKSILHALLLRLLVMAIALAIIFAGGELWTRATTKYIRDARRRRQILLMRRTVVGFLSAIVLLFGFVTRFDSLATFAGFVTAGVAVGLQTILLSVAAYFFIIGRYGIKVGDRITIAGVTGDVIDVGLVRFYMMELAVSGTDLNPTGRVAVFSNAVLFQAGAPLYKQIPGTEYAWHELIVKLAETANYKMASDAILAIVHKVYEGYRSSVEQQHRNIEKWMHISIAPPVIESRLQFEGGSLQLWARVPVQMKSAAETDERLTDALLRLLAENAEIKNAVASMPVIRRSIKA
jgi:small-conductance mechanosensitive channel